MLENQPEVSIFNVQVQLSCSEYCDLCLGELSVASGNLCAFTELPFISEVEVRGLMVTALTFRTSGQGSSPGQVYCVEVILLQCLSPPRYINRYW